jgi:hypothetical protein
MFPNHALRNSIEEYFREVFSVHRQAIWNATKTGHAFQQSRTIDALMQCSLLMNADLSTECVLRRIMNEAKTLVGAEVASVFLVDTGRQELYSTVNSTMGELRIPITAGIAGHVATTGETVVIQDAYNDSRFSRTVDLKTGFKTRSMMCAPLKVKKGPVIGVVQLINKVSDTKFPIASDSVRATADDQCFTADDLQFLEVFASHAATAVATAADRQEVKSEHKDECNGKSPVEGMTVAAEPTSTQGANAATPGITRSVKDASRPFEICKDKFADHMPEGRRVDLDTDVAEVLSESLTTWQLDTLALSKATNNKPLSTLGLYLFDQLGLIQNCDLDQEKLVNFFAEIERGYDDANAYHNRSHAASVMHSMYALVEHGGIGRICTAAFTEGDAPSAGSGRLEMMACLLAAAIHDYEHRGLTNDFLMKTKDERAVLYNDKHVNENHHVAAAFVLLRRVEFNFLANLSSNDYRRLRSLIIDMVLATDMVDHGNLVKLFLEELDASTASSERLSKKGAMLLLQIAMKCADLGHLTFDWTLHLEWVRRLEAEFFAQGDKEKHLGLPTSFLMDRDKPGASKSQVGFFDFVVLPLFRALAQAAPAASNVLHSVTANYQLWRGLETNGADEGDAAGKHARHSQSSSTASSAVDAISRNAFQLGGGARTSRRTRRGHVQQRTAKVWTPVQGSTPSSSA